MGKGFKKVRIGSSHVGLKRTEEGVVHIQGDDLAGIQRGLGYAHARDRLQQMLFTRLVANGTLSQFLFDTEELFAIDFLTRKLGINGDVSSDINNLSDDVKKACAAYCEGINTYLEQFGPPRLSRLFHVPPTPWKTEDSLSIVKLQMYFGLAQAQERTERFILQAIHDGVPIEPLKKLFAPHLDLLDHETVAILQKMRLETPYLDLGMHFRPSFSNNWAVAAKKSASGKPLCATDPHLQVNRLPAIWYEAILERDGDFQMGITAPGFPGMIMGRSSHFSATFTYGMMDVVDFFVEEVKGGKCRRESGWEPLHVREEVFQRKKKGKVALQFFESSTGIIETHAVSKNSLEDGYYASLAWSCAKNSASSNLNALVKLWSARSVEEAGTIVREISLPCNWILADADGGIAYQQSGKLPNRNKSGLFPLLAWKNENLWNGFVEGSRLSSSYNPPCGFVVSANDNKNQLGKPISITLPYSSYRYERICEILSQEKTFTQQEMQQLQADLYSLQAEKYLTQLKEWIPDTPVGRILSKWDLCYTRDSQGATLFEAFYAEVLSEVFGKIFGKEAWKQIVTRKSLLVFTHGHFDQVLLSDDPSWYGEEGKEECFKKVLLRTLEKFSPDTLPCWGEQNSFMMYNIFLNGKMPKFMGFDVGPLKMEGGRATVAASFVFKEKKRIFAAGASYRFVTDLATQEAHTILAGGVSENRVSKYYASDIDKWLSFQYKKLKLK